MADTAFTDGVTQSAAAWANDVNSLTYGYLTSVAGTNTVTATGPNSFSAYGTTTRFVLKPAATNTGATTLNVSGIGAKNVFFNGAACAGGELVASVPVLVQYDGTQFQILGRPVPKITASLGADVALNNTANYFDGPSIAQGTVGTWFVSGTVTLTDTSGGTVSMYIKLWDGTSVVAAARHDLLAINGVYSVSLSGYITTPAGNLRISVRDLGSTSGAILYNATGTSKDSTISAIRIG